MFTTPFHGGNHTCVFSYLTKFIISYMSNPVNLSTILLLANLCSTYPLLISRIFPKDAFKGVLRHFIIVGHIFALPHNCCLIIEPVQVQIRQNFHAVSLDESCFIFSLITLRKTPKIFGSYLYFASLTISLMASSGVHVFL